MNRRNWILKTKLNPIKCPLVVRLASDPYVFLDSCRTCNAIMTYPRSGYRLHGSLPSTLTLKTENTIAL